MDENKEYNIYPLTFHKNEFYLYTVIKEQNGEIDAFIEFAGLEKDGEYLVFVGGRGIEEYDGKTIKSTVININIPKDHELYPAFKNYAEKTNGDRTLVIDKYSEESSLFSVIEQGDAIELILDCNHEELLEKNKYFEHLQREEITQDNYIHLTALFRKLIDKGYQETDIKTKSQSRK